MKNCYFLLLLALPVLIGWHAPGKLPPERVYNFFYLDNSHSRNYQSFTREMYDLVERKVDSLHDIPDASLGLFLSNGQNPEFASNYKGAKNIINKLTNGPSREPNSFFDKTIIIDNLLKTDLSYVRGINFHFFVTEAYMVNDLLGNNAGLLFNTLPGELQYLLDCRDEKINVVIYFPALSKKIQIRDLQSFCNFTGVHKDFQSKIKFHFQPV